ncbi:MAG TPA: hypothetical protein VGE38_03670 [Nocardioides sp.]|uniref:hypothetical protein n=1 Tax=Nocardioides sp. TaxID=35761 RepID=UPI002EDB952D
MLDFELMQRHLAVEDAVSVLLRGHLWVETIIVELIKAELEVPDAWPELSRLSWSSKLGLALAQGNTPDFASFGVLNRLRNRLAHSPAFEPDASAAMELARAVDADLKSFSDVYEIPFERPNPKVDPPAEILRASIEALLGYLMEALIELLKLTTQRKVEALERLQAMIANKSSPPKVT